jgi:hypothetical protein
VSLEDARSSRRERRARPAAAVPDRQRGAEQDELSDCVPLAVDPVDEREKLSEEYDLAGHERVHREQESREGGKSQ